MRIASSLPSAISLSSEYQLGFLKILRLPIALMSSLLPFLTWSFGAGFWIELDEVWICSWSWGFSEAATAKASTISVNETLITPPSLSEDLAINLLCRIPHRNRRADQYFGTLGSILSAQARIPPARFLALVYPAFCRNSTALALRPPERQWTTISLLGSSSWTRFGRSFRGTR